MNLVAGTEGYGVQATTTSAGSGATLGVNSNFNQIGDTVAGLSVTNLTVASSTGAVTNREIVVTHKAAIAANTLSGTYSDTLTYSCLAN